jgi:uncharacterized protein (DUF1501 family)
MDMHTRFRQALNTDEPMWRLREEVQRLLAEGHDRNVLVAQLESFRQHLFEAGRDTDEDTILEVMDFLTGWCSPDVRL